MTEKLYPNEVCLKLVNGALEECNPGDGAYYIARHKYKVLELKISQLQYDRERHLKTIDQLQNEVANLKQQKEKS